MRLTWRGSPRALWNSVLDGGGFEQAVPAGEPQAVGGSPSTFEPGEMVADDEASRPPRSGRRGSGSSLNHIRWWASVDDEHGHQRWRCRLAARERLCLSADRVRVELRGERWSCRNPTSPVMPMPLSS